MNNKSILNLSLSESDSENEEKTTYLKQVDNILLGHIEEIKATIKIIDECECTKTKECDYCKKDCDCNNGNDNKLKKCAKELIKKSAIDIEQDVNYANMPVFYIDPAFIPEVSFSTLIPYSARGIPREHIELTVGQYLLIKTLKKECEIDEFIPVSYFNRILEAQINLGTFAGNINKIEKVKSFFCMNDCLTCTNDPIRKFYRDKRDFSNPKSANLAVDILKKLELSEENTVENSKFQEFIKVLRHMLVGKIDRELTIYAFINFQRIFTKEKGNLVQDCKNGVIFRYNGDKKLKWIFLKEDEDCFMYFSLCDECQKNQALIKHEYYVNETTNGNIEESVEGGYVIAKEIENLKTGYKIPCVKCIVEKETYNFNDMIYKNQMDLLELTKNLH